MASLTQEEEEEEEGDGGGGDAHPRILLSGTRSARSSGRWAKAKSACGESLGLWEPRCSVSSAGKGSSAPSNGSSDTDVMQFELRSSSRS